MESVIWHLHIVMNSLEWMMNMEYRKEVREEKAAEEKEKTKKSTSQLIIESNTIYEIDLDCQYQKDCKCKKGV